MGTAVTDTLHVHYHIVAGTLDPADVVVSFAAQEGAAVLESACNTAGYGRFSLYACAPVAHIAASAEDPGAVAAALRQIGTPTAPGANFTAPFAGGWIGCIPYEAGAVLEGVRRAYGAKAAPHI
ncbi:MAG TPA: hypothetical protein P5572_14875, partial [Phycisphaerae bacterium]|nr:hypothetical protein [Phycisphaerae bacterium]